MSKCTALPSDVSQVGKESLVTVKIAGDYRDLDMRVYVTGSLAGWSCVMPADSTECVDDTPDEYSELIVERTRKGIFVTVYVSPDAYIDAPDANDMRIVIRGQSDYDFPPAFIYWKHDGA